MIRVIWVRQKLHYNTLGCRSATKQSTFLFGPRVFDENSHA